MGLFRRDRHPLDHKPDPMAGFRIDHEYLPIEVKKQIQGRVRRLDHLMGLSQ
jgi:hypothetical protein